MKIKVTAKKWSGDDSYSWAIFRSDKSHPVVCGIHKRQVPYYKKQVEKQIFKGK